MVMIYLSNLDLVKGNILMTAICDLSSLNCPVGLSWQSFDFNTSLLQSSNKYRKKSIFEFVWVSIDIGWFLVSDFTFPKLGAIKICEPENHDDCWETIILILEVSNQENYPPPLTHLEEIRFWTDRNKTWIQPTWMFMI